MNAIREYKGKACSKKGDPSQGRVKYGGNVDILATVLLLESGISLQHDGSLLEL